MIIVYSACIISAIGMLLWGHISDVRRSINQLMMTIIIIISSFGYLFLACSGNVQEAIIATKVIYAGGCFLPMILFFTVSEICQFKYKRALVIGMAAVQIGIYACVCSIGYSNLYYESVELMQVKGVSYLEKVYGPLHMLYPASMYVYYFLCIAIIIYTAYKKKNVNRTDIFFLGVFYGIAVAFYVCEHIFDINNEIIPIAYVILMIGTSFPIYRSNLYTVYENREIINEQLNKIGFITFTEKGQYMGANAFMIDLFPELKNFRPGQSMEDCSKNFRHIILGMLETYREGCQNAAIKVNAEEDASSAKLSSKQQLREKAFEGQRTIPTFRMNDKYYDGVIHPLINYRKKRVGYTIEIWDETEHYKALELSENYNEELSAEVEEKTKRIREIQRKTILGMAQMVESRDLSTGGHIRRTSDVVQIFAEKLKAADMGLSEEFLKLVIRSAPMHDLGKIGVDDAVLRKQGKFTDEEYEIMKKHSEIGFHMVSEILSGVEEPQFVQIAENVAHYHHEKVNGRGYPDGLKGEEIPIEARIMALADVFDALVSKRCYKEAFSYDQAFEIIEKDAGTHFDAELAKIFISCRPELEAYYNASAL